MSEIARYAYIGLMVNLEEISGAIPQFELKHRVRLAREYAGMQQQELADNTGLARSAIAYIESGQGRTRRSSIRLIALATGVDLHWLETGETPAGGTGGGDDEKRYAIRDSNPELAD